MEIDPKNAPKGPGVYIFKDREGTVIYVGKARSIKKRVESYFRNRKQQPSKTQMMLKKADSIGYMLTDTEIEALILESNLIKKHHPKYNILLKDDKSYPHIRVSLEEDYPRVFITRRINSKGSKYFGPYTDVFEIRKTLRYLNNIFGIRTCRDKSFNRSRPCLNYDIKRCTAPCRGNISRADYMKNVSRLMMFLSGKDTQLMRELEKKMLEHSAKKEYEASKVYRDRIDGIKKLASSQKIVSQKKEDADIIAADRKNDTVLIEILFIRSGALTGSASHTFSGAHDTGEILASFIKQYYTRHEIPSRLILSHPTEDAAAISGWLTREKNRKVKIVVPRRGEKHKLVELAKKNAEISLQSHLLKHNRNREALQALKDSLGLDTLPLRIEAFDISNISGTNATGSMVVFIKGEPEKSEYRKYRIRTVKGADDCAMMKEVISRRYSRHALPDLILVDGGRGQLNAALDALGVRKGIVKVIGLAKEFEEIYTEEKAAPLRLESGSGALYLLERVRDEAHRFAVSYHRHLRSKTQIS